MNIVEEALKWARKGIPVFPCSLNKRPMTTNGHLDATTDPEQVKQMFALAGDCMIGARMGADSRLFAIDFDLYKPGAEAYMQSLSDKGWLYETQTHTTQSGGLHFIYRSDTAQPNCKPHPSVEVKGEGGYIILPPSKGYSVATSGISQAHPELVQALLTTRASSSQTAIDKLKSEILDATSFHDPLAQISARRSAQGWPIERVQRELLDLLEASKASRETHPRHSRWKSLMEDTSGELSRLVGSSNSKFNHYQHTEKARETVDETIHSALTSVSSGLFKRPESSSLDNGEATEDSLHISGDGNITEWPFESSGYFDDEERDITQQRYIMYPLVAERETILLAAEPKVGKTAIALKLAMNIANGEDFGSLKVYERRPVLYFTLEGARAVELRIQAERRWRRENNMGVPERSYMFVVDRPHDFFSDGQQEANCAKIALHAAKCQQEFGTDLGLIVIDTITKAMPAGDQNSVEDTSKLFRMVDFLRSNGVTATILFVHHLSKQGQVRGSTNIEAEVDVVLKLVKTKEGPVKMYIGRARSMDEDIHYFFNFESYDLGRTVQGFGLSAPVVRMASSADMTSKGDEARAATEWAKLCEALKSLGVGSFSHNEVCTLLNEKGFIELAPARRLSYTGTKTLAQVAVLFKNRHTWAYGDTLFKLDIDEGKINSLEIRATQAQ